MLNRGTLGLLALLLLLLPLGGCGTAARDTLVVAMELDYPPFEMQDESGNPCGVSVDFLLDFGVYNQYNVRIVDTPWEDLIPSLQDGRADMIISSMTIRPDRAELVDFSVPYANASLAILANRQSGITRAEDLNRADCKIAVKAGSTGYLYACEQLPNAEIVALSDEEDCVEAVAAGDCDGFLYDQLTVYRSWIEHADTTSAIFVPYQAVEQWGVAVQKGDTELLNRVNAFIERYRAEGGFVMLEEKYLAEEKRAFQTFGFQWFFDLV